MTKMDYRGWTVVGAVLAGLIALTLGSIRGVMAPAITFMAITAVMLGLFLWLTRPRLGNAHISHATALAAASGDDIIVYWRPG